jgi:hypothetical protein
MILDATFPLDQVRHPCRGPQTGSITQSLRALREPLLDLAEFVGIQTRLASGTARLLQSGAPVIAQLDRPLAYRLPMSADSPRHFRLTVSLLQQPRGLHPPPLQCHEISAYSGWVSHTHTVA